MNFKELQALFTGIPDELTTGSFANHHISFPEQLEDLSAFDVVLIGVPDSENDSRFKGTLEIRKQLYRLSALSKKLSIVDLGNIKLGSSFFETGELLRKVLEFINQFDIRIAILGGTSVFNKEVVESNMTDSRPLNYISVDSAITWEHLSIHPFFNHPDMQEEYRQVNFINIGYQSYYVNRDIHDHLNESDFEAYRLGQVRGNIQELEPVLRDANLVSFSLNAVKYADAPAAKTASPNGLSGDEFCQLAFYAGHSMRIKFLGIYDYAAALDLRSITSSLSAQAAWYFFEGMANRIFEEPDLTPGNFTKYHIYLDTANQNISFYRSNLSNRWWMEVEIPGKKMTILQSCSESDYELACRQEVPDRWWRIFKRI